MEKKEQVGELADGLVQLRFSDEKGQIHDLNAAEMAETLQGLVEFTSQMAKAGLFGDGPSPELRVRPPQEGSFILEAVLAWAGENPEEAVGTALATGGALVQGLNMGLRRLRGAEPKDFDYLDNGDVKVVWADDKVDQVPAKVWDQLRAEKKQTRKALRKIMAPLSDDADSLEVRDGTAAETTDEILRTEPEAVASRDDYRTAVVEVDDISERTDTFEAEAQLTSIDFRRGEKWRIKTLDGTRQAMMEDEEFLRQVDKGMALHKNDIFDVTIREVSTTKNGRTTRDWSLIKVIRKRRGEDDGNDGASPEESSSRE
ncbi:hypothetical protein [Paenarthrobacter nitroguajacolicus]|uniref:hypothetical protein n=1 Tax=Paenarthrobacter nitroguajacolicus TaxID=211146 RepID=UPI0015BD5870|nr:hypothetical protein [Paenarthrobacter nitroguajacolicus]NWL32996.1 hypothetical protein [Paenarthrobacter nitroguajacolicus]